MELLDSLVGLMVLPCAIWAVSILMISLSCLFSLLRAPSSAKLAVVIELMWDGWLAIWLWRDSIVFLWVLASALASSYSF